MSDFTGWITPTGTEVGFEVEEIDLKSLFGEERFERCALGEERYLQVVRKPA